MTVITGHVRTFYQLLLNTGLVSIINFSVWFAVTFWTYLQTKSVFATGMISGIFLVLTALTGIWFGSLVDGHRKKTTLQGSAVASLALYAAALAVYQAVPEEAFRDPADARLWMFVLLLMFGVIAGNVRTIALPTLVTLLIDEDRRDRANGLVGTVSGTTFLVTSVISGVLVAFDGMFSILVLALVVLALSIVHLAFITIPERQAAPDAEPAVPGVDLRGTLRLIGAVPGLPALILFSTFNNFLGGVFMALADAYGLSLVSVQTWGLLWGVLSTGFIVGGLLVARTGLGSRPVRLLLLINVVLWVIILVFPLWASIIPMAIGMYLYMLLMPYAEAAEQTILQRVVPYERQGRVFGLAQSVEQAASPLTAFLISPITQFVFIPFMSDGGAGADAIGSWFGTGPDRGMALVFVLTGIIGVIATLLALLSRPYRSLSGRVAEDSPVTVSA
ncbi:MFS transporter [Actinoplanes xinjiangensis]|jgi:DHA3 family multidrug efflux protein-like MFS transporter|uniref:DHA3 family multidrug efflux protein-like MFS transporter n=1 Tax=Actinoplanes xinjiangensis TaxID=512350 RepID=A0A316EFB6_9ACTN|nr:MFS transporter [Actinoplanes xinjiangensis]PWK28392.1 DHA3 family multidrug efflux protein-like MFS transporter [Actinoplanes xinjiangensis]GIF37316.1 multidrug resistance protein [Actinoplanes xinjiangensis]